MDEPLLKQAELKPEDESLAAASVPGDCPPVKSVADALEVFSGEMRRLLRIGVPISINWVLAFGSTTAVQIFAGGLGPLELSAVSTAFTVTADVPIIILMGMASALDTLCGQAFGAGQLVKLGTYMKFACIVQIIFAILMCPLYIFASPILRFLGQDHKIAALAGKFAIRILPQLFAAALSYASQKFLYAQSKVAVLAWIGFGGLILNVGTLLLFTHVFAWGLNGAALAINVSSWATCLAQLAYVLLCYNHALFKLPLPTLEEMWAYIKLALASAFMYSLEGWYPIVLVLVTGLLDNPQIAVGSLSICMNIKMMLGTVFLGLTTATSVRVSNELGSGHPRAAKYSILTMGVLSLTLGLICMITIIAMRDYLPMIFTRDKELQSAVVQLAYLLGINVVFASTYPILMGTYVGGGWQYIVAFVDLGCYIFGIFLEFIFGFKLHWRVQGTWGGMLCGVLLHLLILSGIIWKLNWKAEATKTSKRLQLWSELDETTNSRA